MELTKAVGDAVEEDEVICKVESEKIAVDIRAPKSGTLTVVPSDGADVNVGDEIAKIKEGPVAASSASSSSSSAPPAAATGRPTPKPTTPAAPAAANH